MSAACTTSTLRAAAALLPAPLEGIKASEGNSYNLRLHPETARRLALSMPQAGNFSFSLFYLLRGRLFARAIIPFHFSGHCGRHAGR